MMDELLQCATVFGELFNIEYNIVIGRKGKTANITISNDKKDFYHLIGLQYLIDIAYLKTDRGKVFDQIISGDITLEKLSKSDFIDSIRNRILSFRHIETLLDNNDLIFKYNSKFNPRSHIQADYLLKNDLNGNDVYIFIDKIANSEKHFCRSFFPKEVLDYTKNQVKYTLLYKEKVNFTTGEKTIQYDKLTPKD